MIRRSARRARFTGIAVALTLAAALGASTAPALARPGANPAADPPRAQRVCSDSSAPLHARCLSLIRTDRSARAMGVLANRGAALPAGFGPADLDAAYHLPAGGGAGQTVAVVSAFDYPTAEADLATYRATYGLPPCTTANGCFRKLNQDGEAGNYPRVNRGWALESALDLDMVSAACPDCRIILVEGKNPLLRNLAKAVDTAVAAGADVVTNSYGIDEFNGMARFARHYRHPGVAVLASSGDDGFTAASFPAVARGVTAVGGTSLYTARNRRGWTETAWSGAGSGCSAYVAKPAYQRDRHCQMRTTSDVSAVADPQTGVAVYDSLPNPYGIEPGWLILGGTSASSPYVAGLVARADSPDTFKTRRLYHHKRRLYDVVGGSNGFCGGDYLCTAKKGYDGPTGLGTPHGLRAF